MILKGRIRRVPGVWAGIVVQTPEGNIEMSYAVARHLGILQHEEGVDMLLAEDVVIAVTPYKEPEDPHGDLGHCPRCLSKDNRYVGPSLDGQVLQCNECRLVRTI